jgi:hypothetical protein
VKRWRGPSIGDNFLKVRQFAPPFCRMRGKRCA